MIKVVSSRMHVLTLNILVVSKQGSGAGISNKNINYLCIRKVLLVMQSCLTLCDPVDCSLPGSSVHRDSPGKITGVGCYSLVQGILLCRQIHYCLKHQRSPKPPLTKHLNIT